MGTSPGNTPGNETASFNDTASFYDTTSTNEAEPSIYADEPAPAPRRDHNEGSHLDVAANPQPTQSQDPAGSGRHSVSIGTVVGGLVIGLLAVGSMLRIGMGVHWDVPLALAGIGIGAGMLLIAWTGALLAFRRR